MPTTQNEALEIVCIINKYLPVGKAAEVTKELRDKVGRKTSNSSLKVTLEMLAVLYGEPPDPQVLELCKKEYPELVGG
jgi:hypothetical protein